MHYIGIIDLRIYEAVAEKAIITDEVIITDNQIAHIIERRGQEFYDKYHEYFSSILNDPDYVFKDTNPNTALVCRKFIEHGKNVNIVLRLAVEGDDPSYKNSILTVVGENDRRFEQRLRNNTPIYKRKNIDFTE